MLVLIIICSWILSRTVPILSIEKQFPEILSVKILPREPQVFSTVRARVVGS